MRDPPKSCTRECRCVRLFITASVLPAFALADTNAFVFSQDQQLWDRGADIQALQEFLNAQGFLVAQTGLGSPGHETTLFGLLTYHALLNYQAAARSSRDRILRTRDTLACIRDRSRIERQHDCGIVAAIAEPTCKRAVCRNVLAILNAAAQRDLACLTVSSGRRL
jgi:hypothetical protein